MANELLNISFCSENEVYFECFQMDVITSHSLENERLCDSRNLTKKQGPLSYQDHPVASQISVKTLQKSSDSFTRTPLSLGVAYISCNMSEEPMNHQKTGL